MGEGLASQDEVERVTADLIALADDESVLFGFPLVYKSGPGGNRAEIAYCRLSVTNNIDKTRILFVFAEFFS